MTHAAILGAGTATRLMLPGTAAAQANAAKAAPPKQAEQATATPDWIAASNSKVIIETTAGKVRCYIQDGVYVLKDIPYEAPGATARLLPPARPAL